MAPSSDASLLGEERSLMEIMMFLEELLQLGQDKVVRKQIVAILKEIAEHGK